MVNSSFCEIECSEQPLDIAFHPHNPGIVVAGLVDGTIEVHDFIEWITNDGNQSTAASATQDDEIDTIVSSTTVHTQLLPAKHNETEATQACCRTLTFSLDGMRLYSGGSGGDLAALDTQRISTFSAKGQKALLWRIPNATCSKSAGVQVIHEFERNERPYLVTGDERGGVKLWDSRLLGNDAAPVHSWKVHDDYISGIKTSADGHTLLVTSADCTLSACDLRMMSESPDKALRRSDDIEDELLSIQIMKNGRKVVCGTGEGVLSVFSWGTWGDVSDRFPGHPQSIDGLLKIDEDTLLTGSSDGLIRVVQIHPDKLLGVLGDHEGFPIEKLAFNSDRNFVGSVSHDHLVRIWDARILQEDGEDDGNESLSSGGMQVDAAAMAVTQARKDNGAGSEEDDWEDMDEDSEEDAKDDDDDSDDSDDDSDAGDKKKKAGKNDKRSQRLKTDNERFFEDL